MLDVSSIHNFDTMKQAALLLEAEVSRLLKENSELKLEMALQGAQVKPLNQTKMLEEQLAKLQAMCFASSSEKRPKSNSKNEDDEGSEKAKGKTGHGPTPQPKLPVQTTTYELIGDNRICGDCGMTRHPKKGLVQESELITVVGVEFKLEKVTQVIYGCECPDTLVTAPGPDRVTPGGRYSLEFAAFVAAQKYLDHLPLARQQRMMERNGLDITRTALWDQTDVLAGHLEPTWRALHQYTLGADWVHCDETRWQMLGGPGSIRWWAWCLASADSVFYDIHKHRSAQAAMSVLDGFEGVLITDGYQAYETVLKAGPNRIVHAHCWAHVRRKFLEAEAAYPDEAEKAIKWIGQLFRFERELPKLGNNASLAEREKVLAARKKARKTKSRPVIDELRQWAYEILPTVLPSTGLAKAINYMLNLWPGLIVFLSDPRIPIDNNHAERELRGVVVGRKNHYGSKSKRGTVVAATFYSLFESAKLVGVNPEAYVLEAARRAIRSPGSVTLPQDLVG